MHSLLTANTHSCTQMLWQETHYVAALRIAQTARVLEGTQNRSPTSPKVSPFGASHLDEGSLSAVTSPASANGQKSMSSALHTHKCYPSPPALRVPLQRVELHLPHQTPSTQAPKLASISLMARTVCDVCQQTFLD